MINVVHKAIPIGEVLAPRNEKVAPVDYPELPYIGLDNVEAHCMRLLGSKPAASMKSSAKRFYTGDVLYSRLRPYLNKVWAAERDGICSSEFIVLPGNQFVDSKFLALRLNAIDFVSFANSLNAGDRPRVDFDQISSFCLPPFSLSRQHRIVAKIEELLSELDKGVESLKTARAKLKIYRQAVLKHAFEGKLTAQWREENKDKLETPEQLLARIKQERATHYEQQLKEWKAVVKTREENGNPGKRRARPPKEISHLSLTETETLPPLPAGWSYLRLGLVIDEPKYGSSKKCDYDYKGTGVLRIPNVVRGMVDASDLKGAHFDEDEKRTYDLRSGDILMIRSNGSVSIVGRCALISEAEEQYLYAGYLIRLRSNLATLLPEYFAALVSSHLLRTQIEHRAKSTSGVNNINSREIQSLIVPLCSLSEQEVVVERLSTSLSAINAIEAEIDSQLLKADALRQSILKKAFTGQLVAQDPHDEPASILLNRIRAEREQTAKRTTRRKTGKRKTTRATA